MLTTFQYAMFPWNTHNGFTIGVPGGSANVVGLIKTYVPAPLTINKISYEIVSNLPGSFWGFGLYNIAGTTKVVDSGPMLVTSGSIFTIYTSTITPVTVGSGLYWLAYTTDYGPGSIVAVGLDSNACHLITGVDSPPTTILGIATNASVAGQLPSTTGAISAQATPGGDLAPMIKFN